MDNVSTLTEQQAIEIIKMYASSDQGFKSCCELLGYNYHDAWWKIGQNPHLYEKFTHAQKNKALILSEDCISISDTEDNAGKGNNRIKARQWLAKCYDRATYGDKQEIKQSGSLNVEVVYPMKGSEDIENKEDTETDSETT